jgi:hypothetical protein
MVQLAAIETTMASFRKLPLAIRITDHSPSPTSIHLAVSFDQTRKCIGRLRNEAKAYRIRVIPKPNRIRELIREFFGQVAPAPCRGFRTRPAAVEIVNIARQ